MKKKCSSCGNVVPLENFQKRLASFDGLTSSCKSCLRERDKERYQKERTARSALHRAYMQTDRGKKAHSMAAAKWREQNKIKRAAHIILGFAIKKGKIVKKPCEKCGAVKSHGHHEDYSKPLEVIWLCPKHHKEVHQ